MLPLDQLIAGVRGTDLIEGIGAALAAMAALGTAAYGLVDATKAFGGGISQVGFNHILRGCDPFASVLKRATGDADWRALLHAQWINGREKEDQKAVVRSLVRLGLTEGAVEEISRITNIEPMALSAVVEKLRHGEELTEREFNLLGRVDSIIGVHIDTAYERADQQYRNTARVAAACVSLALALGAGFVMDGGLEQNFWAALAAGVLAVPIAPIAKDLVTSLTAAAHAVQATRGR